MAWGAKRRGMAAQVVGADRDPASLRHALVAGMIDAAADAADAVRDADLVVLAVPVGALAGLADELAPRLDPRTVVTDVGSVKRSVVERVGWVIPRFVGGHPMAGGATSGPGEARADLFDGQPWFLTNPDAPDAVHRAVKFVEALGAHAVVLSDHGQEHDRLMAAVSHLPQVTASALMIAVVRAVGTDNLHWAGNGLRDTTRLAASGAAMWESVLASNSRELKPLLKTLAADLSALADGLDDRDLVRRFFEEAVRAKSCL